MIGGIPASGQDAEHILDFVLSLWSAVGCSPSDGDSSTGKGSAIETVNDGEMWTCPRRRVTSSRFKSVSQGQRIHRGSIRFFSATADRQAPRLMARGKPMSRESLRILLADPQTASRHALQVQLEDAGFCVDTATSGSDVILVCDIDPPDILILDVRLPDMDGFEVCEYVRHETRDLDLTVIILTEPTDEMTRTYLGQMVDYAGGDYFLARPCDSKLLIQLIDDLRNERDKADECCRGGFPTRVVWPTTRSPSFASIC